MGVGDNHWFINAATNWVNSELLHLVHKVLDFIGSMQNPFILQVLQKVGKAEKTSDDTFKDDVANFQKQHVSFSL